MSRQYVIPVFIPHLGCPNDCIFCNQKSISGQMKQITEEEVEIIKSQTLSVKINL